MSTTKDPKKEASTLHNPIKDKQSGNVWPIFTIICIGSLAWFLSDPELRRGLAEITGFHALEPIVEQVVNKEFTIDLHGSWTSTCTQRVMVIAREKELDYDMTVVNTSTNAHKTPEWLARHPFGQIPVLEVGHDDHLYESRAIGNYLVKRFDKRGTPFVIEGLRNQVYYDQALSVEAFDFDPTAGLLFREAIIKARNGGVINQVTVDAAKIAFANKMDGYERILSKHEYLAGPNVTLVDLYHLPVGAKLIAGGFGEALTDAKARPHVAKWWKALTARPSWQQVMKDVSDWEEAERKRKEEEEAEREKEHEKADK